MNREIAAHAHADAKDFTQDFGSNSDRALDNLMADVNSEKNKLTPAQYRSYLATLNSDLKAPLNGLTITDVDAVTGRLALTFDGSAGCHRLGVHDERRLVDVANKNVQANGNVTERYSNGSWLERTNNKDKSFDLVFRGGEEDGEHFRMHIEKNGDSVARYSDGTVRSSRMNADGSEVTDGRGPRPQQNYHKVLSPEESNRQQNGESKLKFP